MRPSDRAHLRARPGPLLSPSRQLREESKQLEGELEESRIRAKEAEDRLSEAEAALTAQRDAGRRAADTILRLKQQLAAASGNAAAAVVAEQQTAAPPAAAEQEQQGEASAEDAALAAAAAAAAADPDLDGLSSTEQEILALCAELADVKGALKKVRARAGRASMEGPALPAAQPPRPPA